MIPLTPMNPPDPDRGHGASVSRQGGALGAIHCDGPALRWSILRGGFLGFGLIAVALLLVLESTFSRWGVHPGWWLLYPVLYVVAALTYTMFGTWYDTSTDKPKDRLAFRRPGYRARTLDFDALDRRARHADGRRVAGPGGFDLSVIKVHVVLQPDD